MNSYLVQIIASIFINQSATKSHLLIACILIVIGNHLDILKIRVFCYRKAISFLVANYNYIATINQYIRIYKLFAFASRLGINRNFVRGV